MKNEIVSITGDGRGGVATHSPLEPYLIFEKSSGERAALPVTGLCQLLPSNSDEPKLAEFPDVLPDALALFEPLPVSRSQARLVAIALTEEPMRVNGQPAPRVAVLKERDTVQLNGSIVLHVTTFRRPDIGPPEPAEVGRDCIICRLALTPDSRSYRCPCGVRMHLEEGKPDALECASVVRVCPSCGRDVALTPGFSWFPEVENE